ncbi:unnamed protein product [Timema podura]|uniref:Uncharacterized protein n=1 Tax=Timema podura TaxID=61482 RepID=A0ABN7NFH4_TIMPD|nr:unnamed protein product [Timema podura]
MTTAKNSQLTQHHPLAPKGDMYPAIQLVHILVLGPVPYKLSVAKQSKPPTSLGSCGYLTPVSII